MDLLLIGTAFAQAAGQQPKPSVVELLMLPLGFLVILYFLMIRPQQKKAKEHQELLGNLKAGDEVVTTGGIIGRIRAIADGFVTLDISQNASMKVLKSHVSGLTKPEAQQEAGKKNKK